MVWTEAGGSAETAAVILEGCGVAATDTLPTLLVEHLSGFADVLRQHHDAVRRDLLHGDVARLDVAIERSPGYTEDFGCLRDGIYLLHEEGR